jgi:RimJ/RimL family protein N-acetyltransferase
VFEFVYDHDEEVARFITALTPGAGVAGFGRHKTIGLIDENGRLVAGLIYFNYDPNTAVIEYGGASIDRRWLCRATIRRMFEYPFIECGCQMLVTRVRAENEHLLSQLARLNFNLTYMPRMYGRDEDGVICTLTDDQWLDSAVSKRIYRDVSRKKEAA